MDDPVLSLVEPNSPLRQSKDLRTKQSFTESGSVARRSKTKYGELSQAEKRKRAKEEAAHREQLLNHRNAAYVIHYLERKTRFDKDQIRALQRIYRRFKGSAKMDRLRFREMVASLLGITDNIMLDRIFQAFDGDNEGSVSETEWIIGLSVQLRGTLEQQIAYTYDVYDVNGDRSIGREEISSFYRNSIHAIKGILEPEEVDESINELVELAMKKFDINKDGNIRFTEYRHIIRNDPLLLEAFGECLPKESAAIPFVALLDTDCRNYKSYYISRNYKSERQRYSKHAADHHHAGYVFDNELDEKKTESPSSWASVALLKRT